MSLSNIEFIDYMKVMFKAHGSDWDEIIQLLPKPNHRFMALAHFYYFICRYPNKREKEIREELQLVGVISIIEALMSEIDYLGVFEYFKSTYPGANSIEDMGKFRKEYLEKFGASKKVREYFKKYISEGKEEVENFGIEIINKDKTGSCPLKRISQIADFFYDMRSNFVHNARMSYLRPPNASLTLTYVNEKSYIVKISIESFLKIFERSFVRCYKEKAGIL